MRGPDDHEWKIVEVDALPYPHDLFKCRWRDEFRAIAEGSRTPTDLRAAFQEFVSSGLDLRECAYHQTDWALAAEVACDVVKARRTGPDETAAAIDEAVFDDPAAQEGAWSFFAEPIHLNGDAIGNGQHRSCAMRVQGVTRCPMLE